MVFVNVYEVDRIYGGPEEGGWWFNAGKVVESVEVAASEADALVVELEREYPRTDKVGSVLYQGGDFRVCIEDEEGADYPEKTPHYE